MSDPEATAPPVRPSKWSRVVAAWRWCVDVIAAHPDKALVAFLLLLAVAVVL